MSKLSERRSDSPGQQPSSDALRPYEKPRILHRERLEAVAAECTLPGGKNDPTCVVGFS